MRDKLMTLRLSEDEKKLIEEAAWIRRVPTAVWTRSVALATAKRTIEESKKKT